ncbi:hypothetical protein K1719_005181 [Acacia pycnantha]|nr:hypothetical protein K1719_005181 [Acacia pycnantha]
MSSSLSLSTTRRRAIAFGSYVSLASSLLFLFNPNSSPLALAQLVSDELQQEEDRIVNLFQLKTENALNKLILAPFDSELLPPFLSFSGAYLGFVFIDFPFTFLVKHTKEWLRTAKLTLIVHIRLIHTMNASKLA